MADPFSIAHDQTKVAYQQIYAFSDLTMHSQDNIIGPLTSCNQSENCLKLGILTCVILAPADQA